jgi:hypothetical protein
MATNSKNFEEYGVKISKSRIYVEDDVTIYYDGILAKSGAEMVYLHIGYGDAWNPSEYIPMNYIDGEMKATFKATHSGELNVCFKDTANNWDNNSSENYTFKVYRKPAKKVVVKKAPAKKSTVAKPKRVAVKK